MSYQAFVLTSLLILLTPGPTNTLLAASGAAMGVRKALWLPLAEALGYSIAISLFVAAAGALEEVPIALPLLKGVAAGWLLFSAVQLWTRPATPDRADQRGAFSRVCVTTMLNPKAMLVGTVIIPDVTIGQAQAVLSFVVLSSVAGAGWIVSGAALPAGLRRYSFKSAAVIIAAFSFAAAASAVQG
ncbi:threonine transporter [Rhodopseudomonas palustris]|nr:threonine transporter [Rhodopseudomonas palustris]